MNKIDWSQCQDAESIPGKVSGAWCVKGTRLPVQAILDHAVDFTPEEIATEIFEVPVEVVRRILAFAGMTGRGSTPREENSRPNQSKLG